MSNIIIIEPDKKISFQIKKLFEEMSEDYKVHVFDSLDIFNDTLFESENKDKTPFPCPTVEIIFFGTELFKPSEIKDWCKKVYTRLVQTKRFNQEEAPYNSIHFVAGTYESKEINKFELMTPYIKDIIYYPIDRLLFMQKMEVLFALPKKTTPSYLFSEKVDLPIEISKRSEILKINEIGFQIENPIQLIKGTTAHFYLQLDPSNVIDAYARVSGYRPSSKHSNRFLVNFIYEGLTEKNIKALRLHLAKQKADKLLINDNDEDFLLSPMDMFAKPEAKQPKVIALIIKDDSISGRVKELIEKSLSPVQVIHETSLQDFYNKYLPQTRIQPATEGKDISITKLSFNIDYTERKFKNFVGSIDPTDQILNESIEMIFKDEQGWEQIFANKESYEEFHSQVNKLKGEVPHVFNLTLGLKENMKRLFQFTLFLNAKKQNIQVHIEAPEVSELLKKGGFISKLDLMLLDDASAPENIETWKNQINTYLNKNNMLKKKDSYLKVIRLTESATEKDFMYLNKKDIQSIHNKPMSYNQLLSSIADLLKITYTKYKWDNFNWLEQKKPLHIGTPSHLESLSEFGAFIKHSRPIAPGTFLFLHKGIFDQAPNKSLCVRFYYTEEDSSEKDQHLSYFTYFGINDHFLKYVRSWIRENYASKKNL